ncbi:hypothetical protein D3C86_2182570 [compost metagenome]
MACSSTPLICASAVLASRADTPIRRAPVASLISAQRSWIAARLNNPPITLGNSTLLVVLSRLTNSLSRGNSPSP